MSIKSYRENVAKKVAGPHLPVCFPAALEQISPHHKYRPNIYRNYREFVEWWSELSKQERDENIEEYESMIDTLAKPLGGLACEDLIFRRIRTPESFIKIARCFLKNECRVVIDIKYGNYNPNRVVHSVGVIPVSGAEYVTLVSTHIPSQLRGVIPLEKIANKIAISTEKPMKGHPVDTANFIALPTY